MGEERDNLPFYVSIDGGEPVRLEEIPEISEITLPESEPDDVTMAVLPIRHVVFDITPPEQSQEWRDFISALVKATEKLNHELTELNRKYEKGIENRKNRAIRRAKRQKEKERRKRLKEGAKRGD